MINDVLRARRIEGGRDALRALRGALTDDGRQKVDLRPTLGELSVPVTILTGQHDTIVSSHPDLAHDVVRGGGHLMHIELAEEVSRRVLAFVEGAE